VLTHSFFENSHTFMPVFDPAVDTWYRWVSIRTKLTIAYAKGRLSVSLPSSTLRRRHKTLGSCRVTLKGGSESTLKV
jgi:hypothetical protein